MHQYNFYVHIRIAEILIMLMYGCKVICIESCRIFKSILHEPASLLNSVVD